MLIFIVIFYTFFLESLILNIVLLTQFAALSFASAVRLIPIEIGIANPPDMNPILIVEKIQKRAFLEQLLDGSKIPNHSLNVIINAELRLN